MALIGCLEKLMCASSRLTPATPHVLRCVVTLFLLTATALVSLAEEFKPLFNGRNLDGWEQKGGKAVYTIEGNMIVGTTVQGEPNSFLCTKKDYADFVLEFEFKVDPRLNSGVQFRSQCFEVPTVFVERDQTKKIPAGRVHGYQCEIDMDPKRDRWWTAGLYEEGRRGWLFPGRNGGNGKEFTVQGRKVSRPEEWNKVRIEANGDSIKIWLNDVQRSERH